MITYIAFIKHIIIGGAGMHEWSPGQAQTSALHGRTKAVDKGSAGILIEYRAGNINHDIVVPWSNIAQVTYDIDKAEPKAKK